MIVVEVNDVAAVAAWDRGFESLLLQQRVSCELGPGSSVRPGAGSTDPQSVSVTAAPSHCPRKQALSLCTCCRHYPGAADGRTRRSKITHPYQPSPIPLSGRPAHRPFRGLLGVHSRCGLHTRAVTLVTAIRGLQTFRHLHACSGCFRLERIAGWALHPLEKRRLVTAHVDSGPSPGPARATTSRRFQTYPRSEMGSFDRGRDDMFAAKWNPSAAVAHHCFERLSKFHQLSW